MPIKSSARENTPYLSSIILPMSRPVNSVKNSVLTGTGVIPLMSGTIGSGDGKNQPVFPAAREEGAGTVFLGHRSLCLIFEKGASCGENILIQTKIMQSKGYHASYKPLYPLKTESPL
jgi:hypothetical protein